MSVISVIVGLYSVYIQINNGQKELSEVQITPDFMEANNTREERSFGIELILDQPANYHTFNELPILFHKI